MKEGYKQTELGVIPEDWEIKRLGDIGSVLNGITYHPDDILDSNNGTLVLRSSNIKDDYLVYDDNVYISNKIKFTPVELNDILICVRNGSRNLIGKSAKIDSKAVGEGFGAFMSVYRSTYNSYIYYYFKSPYFYNDVHRNLGATINSINNNDLKKFKIPVPPIEEQNAIANCLSTWDEAIEKQQKLIEAKEIRHKALMQKLLSGKKRLPGFTDEWKEYKFSDLIKEVKRKETWDDTKLYDLISVRRRSGGVFHRESLYGHQIEVKSLVKIKENDFLISKMQIVHGASSIVPKKFEDYYVSGSYIILNIKNDKILNPKYLNLYSKQKSFYYQTFVSSYGVHIEKMTFDFKTFLKMSAIIPILNEQNRIVEIIDTSNQELEIEKQKVEQLKEQKKALMQKLLTGKVRLPLNN